MLALNWFVYLSFGIAFASTAALAPSIVTDLRLGAVELGLVLGAWQIVYVFCALPAGVAADAFGLRRGIGVGATIVALSALARQFAVDFPTLFFAVALFGIGGPLISIGSNKLISEWFPPSERGLAIGVTFTAPTIGQVSVLALANSFLVPATGSWRGALVVCASVSVAAALLWFLRARERPSGRQPDQRDPRLFHEVPALIESQNVRLILLGALTSIAVAHGVNGWIPTILISRGFTPEAAGIWAATSAGAGLFAVLLIPRVAVPGRRRVFLATLSIATAAGLLGMATTSGLVLTGALVAIGFGRSATTPLMMLLLMETDAVGPGRMGTAAGLYFTVGELGGFAGPAVIGLLLNATGGFLIPLGALAALLLVAALTSLGIVERSRTPVPAELLIIEAAGKV